MGEKKKRMQDNTGQAASSSADHTDTDLGGLCTEGKQIQQGLGVCLMKVVYKKIKVQSSGTETNMYTAKHKSILAFPPPSYS